MTIEQFFIRFIVAIIVGVFIGSERESLGKKAGIRTIMLVTSGSALYTMISILMPEFAEGLYSGSARVVDVSRVISNIVVGIGFLGAGVIMKTHEKDHDSVQGLTTAALVWTSAAIGILIGLGLLWQGVVIGAIISILLFTLRETGIVEAISPEESENKKKSKK